LMPMSVLAGGKRSFAPWGARSFAALRMTDDGATRL